MVSKTSKKVSLQSPCGCHPAGDHIRHHLFGERTACVTPPKTHLCIYVYQYSCAHNKSTMSENVSMNVAAAVAAPEPEVLHGGQRYCVTYTQKSLCMEADSIQSFIADIRCGCRKNCIHKLAQMGEAGVQVVHNLRSSRFTGGINGSTGNP